MIRLGTEPVDRLNKHEAFYYTCGSEISRVFCSGQLLVQLRHEKAVGLVAVNMEGVVGSRAGGGNTRRERRHDFQLNRQCWSLIHLSSWIGHEWVVRKLTMRPGPQLWPAHLLKGEGELREANRQRVGALWCDPQAIRLKRQLVKPHQTAQPVMQQRCHG